jgi:hypothetical protein
MALTGNSGPAGSSDLTVNVDEGNFAGFLRTWWDCQSLTTDEAVWGFSSNTDPVNMHQMAWDPSNLAIEGLYYRCMLTIAYCNSFIQNASDNAINSKGFSALTVDTIKQYRAEARFMRAFNYWIMMDLFGNPPFITDSNAIGSYIPRQITRANLFNYVVSELNAIGPDLIPATQRVSGRANQAADWALLSRVYLNAGVYLGPTGAPIANPYYDSVITYCNKVIGAGYSLHPKYEDMMCADNAQLNNDEFILTINCNSALTQTYSGTTFLVAGPAGVPFYTSGITAGSWNCIRITQQFVGLFDPQDNRAQFWDSTQLLNVDTLLGNTADGYSSTRYRDITSTGGPDPNALPSNSFSSVNFPLFRLGEIYLNYAEASVMGAPTGNLNTALAYINALRLRGFDKDSLYRVTTTSALTPAFILNERGKEMMWECLRRTDLVRFNEFTTGTYLWAWKGNIQSGTAVGSYRNLFPIPQVDLGANPNLVQNPGY